MSSRKASRTNGPSWGGLSTSADPGLEFRSPPEGGRPYLRGKVVGSDPSIVEKPPPEIREQS